MAAEHASDRLPQKFCPGASDRQRPGRMRSSQASSSGTARSDGTQRLTRGRVRERRLAATRPGYDRAVARTANTANTAAAQRSAAAQQLRGAFADGARERKLVDELIAERRAETVAEDRAADVPRPRPGR